MKFYCCLEIVLKLNIMSGVEKKKILVCDSQNFLCKILKKSFDIERFKYYAPMGNYYSSHILIYVLYNERELSWFKRIFRKGIPVLVCVFNKKVLHEITFFLEKGDCFFLLDGSQINKSEILSVVKLFLNYSVTGYSQFSLGRYIFHEYGFDFYDSEL